MKILIFSDSHGAFLPMKKAIETHRRLGEIDYIFFLGDGINDISKISELFPDIQIECVIGNCDLGYKNYTQFKNITTEKIIRVGPFNFLLTHGHKLNVKYTYQRAADYAISQKADILCFGHTHRSEDITIDGTTDGSVRMINPGSANGGYHSSYAVLEIVGPELVCVFGIMK